MRRFSHLITLILAIGWGISAPLSAQDKATLLADRIEIKAGDMLVASGAVEVFHGDQRLTAQRVIYDRSLNRLIIEGPITLDDGKNVVILASTAELDDDFRNGIIRSAQVIIDQQLQVTTGALQRVDGRYNTMQSVAASSCQICQGRAPLWEIRARQVVHDTLEKQLYFTEAQFRLAGVPVAYFPRLRLADPTLKRATGFLIPRIEVSSSLGFGIKTPYFIAISPSKDLLITPFAADSGERSVELRYRQAFRNGNITVTGAYSNDTSVRDFRGYLLAYGTFQLPRGYTLKLLGETVSDEEFFSRYGLTEKDRFVTSLDIGRYDRGSFVQGRILGFYSVRLGDNNRTQPSQMAEFQRQQRLDLGLWGEASFGVTAGARVRASDDPNDGADSDTAADGRDVVGYGVQGEWQKSALLPFGVLGKAALGLRADNYRVSQDALFAGDYQRQTAAFAAELRWPLIKAGRAGAVQTLEPMAQLVLAPESSQRLFNEDGALVEFDEGNLFSLNRFPGSDRVELGNRLNLGVNYTYQGASGTRAHVTLGRVFSDFSTQQFALASGLGQAQSDWLVAGQLDMNNQLGLTARALITDQGALRKFEMRGAVTGKTNALSLGYLFTPADADEGRSNPISEISLFTKQTVAQRWNFNATARYDAEARALSRSGIGVVYRNECLQVDLSLSRNFTTSSTVEDNTVFGLSVALLGFGGQAAGAASQCRG